MKDLNQVIRYTKLFIGNQFVDAKSGQTFPTVNPVNGQTLVNLSLGDRDDVDLAVQCAHKAMRRGSLWRAMDASTRAKLINRLANLIERDMSIIATLEALDTGKPYAFPLSDVEESIKILRYYAGWTDKIYGDTIPSDGNLMTYTKKEPIGVVGQITTWDWPIAMLAWKWSPALAAGCCIVMKPSSRTSLTALYVAALTVEAGFPKGVVNVITGYGPIVGQAISSHPLVRQISFSGTPEVGKNILELSIRSNFKRTSLNLGGNSPLVVLKDVNIKRAVKIAHYPVYANYIYVQDEIYDEFVKLTVEEAKNRKIGTPFEKGVLQGPVIDKKLFDRVMNYISAAISQGAKLEYGGRQLGTDGYFIEPTVFSNLTNDMPVAKEEVYGPVQLVFRFKTLDEIIIHAENTWCGAATGILTNDINNALELATCVEAGTVWINTWNAFTPQAPFGGYKQAGKGREFGWDALKQYLEIKTVSINMSPR